jgi:CBS domain containing-hemolysin-like protein
MAGKPLLWALRTVDLLALPVLPVVAPLAAWHHWLNRLQDARADADERATAEDEIMSLVEKDELEDAPEAALEADERRMIKGVFDLDETLVREIMTPRVDVDAVEESASVAEVRARIAATGHSRIPVYRASVDNVVGVIYAKDLLDEENVRKADSSLADICHAPMFLPEAKNIGDLLHEFRQQGNHFAIVLDEYGGTAGIVTFEDILEEIVGDIRDEYDLDEVSAADRLLPDSDNVVDARISIAELNHKLDLDLPEDGEFDTLGGYILAIMGRIPEVGETLQTESLVIEILAADRRRVRRAKLRRRETPAGSDSSD